MPTRGNSLIPMYVTLFSLCAALSLATTFARGWLFGALLAVDFCLILIIRVACRGRRWHPIRYVLGCFGFAILAIAAWRSHREAITAVLAILSVGWGVASFVKLSSRENESTSEEEAR